MAETSNPQPADRATGMAASRGSRQGSAPRHAVVVAGGDTPSRAALDSAWPGWDEAVALVVAADRGLVLARALGLSVDVLVGDLDSLDAALLHAAESNGLQVRRARPDKDESDTELAVIEAVRLGARRITLLGGLGGRRLDHALANVWLLAHPALDGHDIALLDETARVSLIRAPGPDGRAVTRRLDGPAGGTISLLPFGGDAEDVTTHGLRYPLRGERLVVGPARGLSNVRVDRAAAVTVGRGRLLIVEAAIGPGELSSP
jgi:thiamine pyrophosphokinase